MKNLGNKRGKRITVEFLADQIISLAGSVSIKEFRDPRIGDIRDSLSDMTKAQNELGFSPVIDIDEGLRRTIDWMKKGKIARN